MAIISFADPYVSGNAIWINPAAVEQVRPNHDGNSAIFFISGSPTLIVGGPADFVVSKLNEAMGT